MMQCELTWKSATVRSRGTASLVSASPRRPFANSPFRLVPSLACRIEKVRVAFPSYEYSQTIPPSSATWRARSGQRLSQRRAVH